MRSPVPTAPTLPPWPLGEEAAAFAEGEDTLAIGIGHFCCMQAGNGGVIVSIRPTPNDVEVTIAHVGKHGIKANTLYTVDAYGDFVESVEDEKERMAYVNRTAYLNRMLPNRS